MESQGSRPEKLGPLTDDKAMEEKSWSTVSNTCRSFGGQVIWSLFTWRVFCGFYLSPSLSTYGTVVLAHCMRQSIRIETAPVDPRAHGKQCDSIASSK